MALPTQVRILLPPLLIPAPVEPAHLLADLGTFPGVRAGVVPGEVPCGIQGLCGLCSLQWLRRWRSPVGAQAAPGASGEVPSQAEVDAAIASLEERAVGVFELKAPRPSWFTPELEPQVRADGMAAAPVDAPFPGQVGIRPGSMMISPFICTMNYIFQKGDTVAIGTAGHCLDGNEPVVLLTVAPTGGNPVLVELGQVLLRRNAGVGQDYALVEVPPERRDWVFPTIAEIGGPCGNYSGGDPQPVAHYGHGLVGGSPGTPRAGMGFELTKEQQQDLNRHRPHQGRRLGLGRRQHRLGRLPLRRRLGQPGSHRAASGCVEPDARDRCHGPRALTDRLGHPGDDRDGSRWTLVNSPLCLPALGRVRLRLRLHLRNCKRNGRRPNNARVR